MALAASASSAAAAILPCSPYSSVCTPPASANLAPRSSSSSSSSPSRPSLSSPVIFCSSILCSVRFVCPATIRNQRDPLPCPGGYPYHMSVEDIFHRNLGNGTKSDRLQLSFMSQKLASARHGSDFRRSFRALSWEIGARSMHYHNAKLKHTSLFIRDAVPSFFVYSSRKESSNKTSVQASGSNDEEEAAQYVSHEERSSACASTPTLPHLNVRDDEMLIRKAALAADADSVLSILASKVSENPQGFILALEDCSILLQASLAEDNAELAFSIFNAMQRRAGSLTGFQWPQPDVRTYITLIKGLTASLRVTDALGVIGDVKRRGIPAGEEVPFGKVVKCPSCNIALAVVQPQHGLQLVPCSKCRYQYELMSGDVVSCESESISMNISAFKRALRTVWKKQSLPSAVHSLVIKSPDGMARTYRFATVSADVPAQPGERITVASAAPEDSARGLGPFKISARAPGWRPSEPMSITNHFTGSIYPLIRAPPKSGSGAELDTRVLAPAIFILASSDAATALIDPTLPRTIAVTAAAAAVFGTAANNWILPVLNQLPQRTADAIAFRQELLAQYEVLQTRLQDLTQGAAEEVRILARLCQLQNKMEAVQEPTYSARLDRIRRAREGLDERLASRLELIDSYAKVSSMIEIEVEMDINVLAAEEGAAMASIAAQIEQLEEAENLQKQWRMQAEVNDEVERLLQSTPVLTDAA